MSLLEKRTLLTPWYVRYFMLCEQRMLWGTLVYLPVGWENSLHIAYCKYSPHAGLFIDKQPGLFIIVETSLRTAGVALTVHPFLKCYRLINSVISCWPMYKDIRKCFGLLKLNDLLSVCHLKARNPNVSISDLIFISHCCHLQVS